MKMIYDTSEHKKYSLGQLENFLYDAMSSDATPQEIYDVIVGVVSENYYTYKHQASQAHELLALLNGNGKGHISDYDYTELMSNPQYTDEELDGMCAAAEVEQDMKNAENFLYESTIDPVKKWVLPVTEDGDECIINFPDDLLEAANLKEGDTIQWIDQGDGSFKIIKKEN